MELRHLRYASRLAERLNFTQAAASLHVTQSTLSHQIRQLEDELGCRLFDRSARRVRVTRAGETFLPNIRRALAEIDLAVISIKQRADEKVTGNARLLTGVASFSRLVLPQCMTALSERGSQLNLVVEQVSSMEFPERLTPDYDLAIGDSRHSLPDYRFEPLYRQGLGLVVPLNHRFAKRKRIRLVDLHGEPIILPCHEEPTRQILDDAFAAAGVKPIVPLEINQMDSLFSVVLSTGMPGTAPGSFKREGLRLIPLVDPVPERTIGFYWADKDSLAPHLEMLADIIRQAAETVGR